MEENGINSNENIENVEVTSLDQGVMTADYYDNYYNKVLNLLTSIEENQQTVIYNQEQLHLSIENKFERLQEGIDVLVFLIGLTLIYTIIRNMLKR